MLMSVSVFCASCVKNGLQTSAGKSAVPKGERVFFSASGSVGSTKTSLDSECARVMWSASDRLALWARSSDGSYELSGQEFRMYGYDGGRAFFTADLPGPMPEDNYEYRACYPVPMSVDGTVASFELPAVQNGLAAGGADIMVSDPVSHPELSGLPSPEDYSTLQLVMNHLVHLFKFFFPAGSDGLDGENIKKIECVFPKDIAGTVVKDIAVDGSSSELRDGTNTVVLNLERQLAPSTSAGRNYASACIFPVSFPEGGTDKLEVTVFSDNWIGYVKPIALSGRNFAAGHATPVGLEVEKVAPYFTLVFRLAANNLGEPVQKITFSVPSGKQLGEEGSDTFVYEPGGNLELGANVRFSYMTAAKFRALGGCKVNISYESEHVICSQQLTCPDLGGVSSANLNMTVPYLLYEDFSSVQTFSSNDEHSTSSTGSKSAYSFLGGWTGGRVGAQAGKCIRIAGRRECGFFVDAHYPARVDSAPLPHIKKAVDVELTFNYGTNRDYTMSSSVKGQHIYVGYVTSAKAYASGDTDGVYEGGSNNIDTEELTGSWTNLPNKAVMTISNVPSGSENRISWRNDPYGKSEFGANTTSWCYIDNVIVKVKTK